MLDPLFPCMSPASADPDSIPMRARVEELERELDYRRKCYGARVDKGTMTPQRRDDEIEGMKAIWFDQHTAYGWEGLSDADFRAACTRRAADLVRFPWERRVAMLRREIDMRRRLYPQWVERGTLKAGTARIQLERLEAVHFHYWRHANHFMPADLQHLIGKPIMGADRTAFLSALRTHQARFDPAGRRGEYLAGPATVDQPEQQQEMFA